MVFRVILNILRFLRWPKQKKRSFFIKTSDFLSEIFRVDTNFGVDYEYAKIFRKKKLILTDFSIFWTLFSVLKMADEKFLVLINDISLGRLFGRG